MQGVAEQLTATHYDRNARHGCVDGRPEGAREAHPETLVEFGDSGVAAAP